LLLLFGERKDIDLLTLTLSPKVERGKRWNFEWN
jgi:hypothetical protein